MAGWYNAVSFLRKSFTCGFCSKNVAPSIGYINNDANNNAIAFIVICPNCDSPTYFDKYKIQFPKVRLGEEVQGISDAGVESLYNEARDCTSVGAYTSVVMTCRKILMNLAVQHDAKENQSFVYYVEFLAEKGYVPPNGKPWVDEIRKKGNDANHEIRIMTEPEAKQILKFVEMLLRFNYEFPSMLNPPETPSS